MSASSRDLSEIAFLEDSDQEAEEEQIILTHAFVGEYLFSQTEMAIILCQSHIA